MRDSQKEFGESFNRDNQRLSDMLLTCEEDRAEADESSVCLKGSRRGDFSETRRVA